MVADVLAKYQVDTLTQAMDNARRHGEAKYVVGRAIMDNPAGRAYLKAITDSFKRFCKTHGCSMQMTVHFQTITFTRGFPEDL